MRTRLLGLDEPPSERDVAALKRDVLDRTVVPDVDDVHVPHPNDHDRCQCREEDQ